MTTTLTVRVNYVEADVNYDTTPADYIDMDLTNDYLIWTAGDTVVKDLMLAEPLAGQLNTAATLINPDVATTVAKCLLMDYSHNVGVGAYYTHLVKGMGENKRYVFCFSFDEATASEPQLEAWDDSDHDTTAKHVLGNATPANSMVKAICTTASLPGSSWAGTAIAGSGAGRFIQLNNGNGALTDPGSGLTADLYANIKIVIPAGYATPVAETFVLTCRYTWS